MHSHKGNYLVIGHMAMWGEESDKSLFKARKQVRSLG